MIFDLYYIEDAVKTAEKISNYKWKIAIVQKAPSEILDLAIRYAKKHNFEQCFVRQLDNVIELVFTDISTEQLFEDFRMQNPQLQYQIIYDSDINFVSY